jgi:uncharacterized protein YecE (DUF72 family)
MNIRIGTAAWTLPKQHAHHFPEEGSHLIRYTQRLNCVEINSSFHRPHMLKTWQRWAATTPPHFKFAVKIPKTITHQAKLINTGALLQTFLDQVNGLGEKLGPLLIQLPPKLAFDEGIAHEFLTTFRELHTSQAVLEPRHATWFTPAVDRLLRDFEISRVAADPPKGSPLAAKPGGWQPLRYFRLHGAPAPTTPTTPTPSSKTSPRSSKQTPPASPKKPGSSSTTPPSATPPPTHSTCVQLTTQS